MELIYENIGNTADISDIDIDLFLYFKFWYPVGFDYIPFYVAVW